MKTREASLLILGGCTSASGFVHGISSRCLVQSSAALGTQRTVPSKLAQDGRCIRRWSALHPAPSRLLGQGGRNAQAKVEPTHETFVVLLIIHFFVEHEYRLRVIHRGPRPQTWTHFFEPLGQGHLSEHDPSKQSHVSFMLLQLPAPT